ncbi:MAG TPA: DEAD/DEAH box helicase [Candidatus Aenigmarchaeota archaeon]|nr:DEAD/DEAH box helicase [Candidatus Aenigmarchaeota archaeon]
MVFRALDERIRAWLEKVGYSIPTSIQRRTIPKILEGKNCLVIAPAGFGKTLAAILPIFHKIINSEEREGIQLLYITPLRSLNRDIFKRIVELGEEVGIEVDIRHGDTKQYIRKLQAESPPDVMITTPESVQLLLFGKRLREHLRKLKFVIIDEVHELVNKRGYQLSVALERLAEVSGEYQRIGISATVGDPREVGKLFFGKREFEIISVFEPKEFKIEVIYPKPGLEDKRIASKLLLSPKVAYCIRRIKEIVDKHRSTLIFVNTREIAEVLGLRFRLLGAQSIEVHHGSLARDVRVNVEEEFRRGRINGIICTSSLELGIDIGTIETVIQYMSPRQVTKALQRIGRSAHRVGGVSRGLIFTIDPLDYFEALAIRELASLKVLEKQKIEGKPLDVLANQVIAICIDLRDPKIEEVFSIIKRAYPFNRLSFAEFKTFLKFLEEIRLIRIEGDRISKTRKALRYFLDNISMIPDEKQYLVVDKELNRGIGILHQEFVADLDIGSTFSLKGETWRVVDLVEDKIFVIREKTQDPLIPGWEGELIPVPFEVAQKAREFLQKSLEEKLEMREIQGQEDFFIPREDEIYIESFKDFFLIFTFFGTKVNNTLAELLSALIASRYGTVAIKNDAYRIILRFPGSMEELAKVIKEIKPEHLRYILRTSLRNSTNFLYRFFHVARRFGVISKASIYSKSKVKKLVRAYMDTPVFEETIRELFHEKMDLERTKEILERVREGKLRIVKVQKNELSPLSKLSLETKLSLFQSEEAKKEVLRILEERILRRKLFLVCMNCKTRMGTFTLKNLPDDLKCSKCGARTIGCVHDKDKLVAISALTKKKVGRKLNREEKIAYNRLEESSELFLNYGKIAFFVLSAYGIGPKTAKRILLGKYDSKEEMLERILEFERFFLRTRKFWHDK